MNMRGEQIVQFGRGYSAPYGCYVRGRRVYKLFWVAGLSPFLLLPVLALAPADLIVGIGKLSNYLFGTHLREAQLEGCSVQCGTLSFRIALVPLSWILSTVLALIALPLSFQNWQAGREAIRRGTAPYGRFPNGAIRPPPAAGMSIIVGLCGLALLGALVVGGVAFLYLIANTDHTISHRREISPILIIIWMAVIMSLVQVIAVAFAMCATNVALSFREMAR